MEALGDVLRPSMLGPSSGSGEESMKNILNNTTKYPRCFVSVKVFKPVWSWAKDWTSTPTFSHSADPEWYIECTTTNQSNCDTRPKVNVDLQVKPWAFPKLNQDVETTTKDLKQV